MTKLDEAWMALKPLPKREQDIAAQAIFDFASGSAKLGLSSAQATVVRSRLREKNSKGLVSSCLSDASEIVRPDLAFSMSLLIELLCMLERHDVLFVQVGP